MNRVNFLPIMRLILQKKVNIGVIAQRIGTAQQISKGNCDFIYHISMEIVRNYESTNYFTNKGCSKLVSNKTKLYSS